MFKYNLKDVKPSNELFGTIITLLFFAPIIVGTISMLIDTIAEKFKGKKPLDERIKESIYEWDFTDLITGNDFPRVDWTDAKDGKHWEIDPAIRKEMMTDNEFGGDPLIFPEVVDFATYISFLKRYGQYLQFLSSLRVDENSIKLLQDKFNALFKKDEVEVTKTGIGSIEIKSTNVVWPNSPYFKNPVECNKQRALVGKAINVLLNKLASSVKSYLSEDDKGKTREYLASKVAFFKSCEVALQMNDILIELPDFYALCLNNDNLPGCCLVLKDKNGKDITDHH